MNFKKIIRFTVDKDYRFLVLAGRGKKANMPAEAFLKRMYKIKMGKDFPIRN